MCCCSDTYRNTPIFVNSCDKSVHLRTFVLRSGLLLRPANKQPTVGFPRTPTLDTRRRPQQRPLPHLSSPPGCSLGPGHTKRPCPHMQTLIPRLPFLRLSDSLASLHVRLQGLPAHQDPSTPITAPEHIRFKDKFAASSCQQAAQPGLPQNPNLENQKAHNRPLSKEPGKVAQVDQGRGFGALALSGQERERQRRRRSGCSGLAWLGGNLFCVRFLRLGRGTSTSREGFWRAGAFRPGELGASAQMTLSRGGRSVCCSVRWRSFGLLGSPSMFFGVSSGVFVS